MDIKKRRNLVELQVNQAFVVRQVSLPKQKKQKFFKIYYY